MIVFDLQCSARHVFEGWFAGVDDFQQQRQRGMLLCPLCGDSTVSKRLSAPHLNLGTYLEQADVSSSSDGATVPSASMRSGDDTDFALQQGWVESAKQIVAGTEDVGNNFSHEARRIHYGEAPERGIRGYATLSEAVALRDEGISVMPFVLPESVKKTLQ